MVDYSQDIADLQAAVDAIDTELGANPSGVYTTVNTRLDILESRLAAQGLDSGGFSANGDLSGNYLSQIVAGIQGRAIDSSAPADGYGLLWNSATLKWEPKSLSTLTSVKTVGTSGSMADYICDGTGDEVEINNAINAVNASGGGTVKLLPGVYYVDNSIVMKSNVNLVGDISGATKILASSTYDFVNNYGVIVAQGSEASSNSITLTANVSYGANNIQIDNTGVSGTEYTAANVEDYLLLLSEADWEPLSDLSGRNVGEFIKVYNKNTSDFDIYGMTRQDYYTTDTARLYRVNFVKNISIQNIGISQQSATETNANAGNCILLFCVDNAAIKNCQLHDWDGAGVGLYNTININILQNNIYNLTDKPSSSFYGYGVVVGGASEQITISNNIFSRLRHSLTTGYPRIQSGTLVGYGISRNVVFANNTVSHATNSAIDTHAQSDGITISNNTVSSCDTWGIFTRGRGTHVMNNSIEWSGGGICVGIAPTTSGGSGAGTMVIGNTIRHIKSLTSNTFNGAITGSGEGIRIVQTDHAIAVNNAIEYCDKYGIFLGVAAKNNIIKNNTILNANTSNSSNIGAITFVNSVNSSAASITSKAGSTMTLTYGGTGINSNYFAGQTVVISGASDPNNNGSFIITNVVSTSSIEYTNAAGSAPDANNGTITFGIEGATDNHISDNTAINTSGSRYDIDSVGYAKYFLYDAGDYNNRNLIKDNTAIAMVSGLFNTSSSTLYKSNNSNTDGTVSKTVAGTPSDSDFISTPQVGTFAFDSTNNRNYVRSSSGWIEMGINPAKIYPDFVWDSSASTPTIQQAQTSGAGTNFSIKAQNSSADKGGNLLLSAGTGSTGDGVIRFCLNGTNAIQVSPQPLGISSISAVSSVSEFKITQVDNSADSAIGSTLLIQAQGTTGLTSTGGTLSLKSGTGTSAAGDIDIYLGANTGNLKITNITTSTTASNGAQVLPANPDGFIVVYINGVAKKIPYYPV